MDFIFIDDLRVDANVGVYPREQAAPQMLQIDLTFGVPEEAAAQDSLGDTIDYAQVIARIRQELKDQRFNLLETLGEHIVALLLDEFGAPWVRLSVAKVGIMKGVKRVGVFIERGQK
jgi:7,8-dihydroneopterin aldolase/epimerase/oxygenase